MLCYPGPASEIKSLQCFSTKLERSKGLITFIPIFTPPHSNIYPGRKKMNTASSIQSQSCSVLCRIVSIVRMYQ